MRFDEIQIGTEFWCPDKSEVGNINLLKVKVSDTKAVWKNDSKSLCLAFAHDECFIYKIPEKTAICTNIDITVRIHRGLNEISIERIQQIEKAIDSGLGHVGYSRSASTKNSDYVEFNYYQFAFKSKDANA